MADEAQVRALGGRPAVEAAAGRWSTVCSPARHAARAAEPERCDPVKVPDRFPLGVFPTPLHRAHRLETALGCGPLWVKRDDLTGFAVAGNKARPLEYLLGAALAAGADVLVTGGGPGSNFAPAAALAARAAGLDCEVLVAGDPRARPNLALAAAAGATLRSDRPGTAGRSTGSSSSGPPSCALRGGGPTPCPAAARPRWARSGSPSPRRSSPPGTDRRHWSSSPSGRAAARRAARPGSPRSASTFRSSECR